jgi:hypothetical protein
VTVLPTSFCGFHARHGVEHSALLITMQPAGRRAAAEKPERWLRFLDEAMPGDPTAHQVLQEWVGYILSERTDLQKVLMLIGPTRCGKGTIDRLLRALVGEDNHRGLSSPICWATCASRRRARGTRAPGRCEYVPIRPIPIVPSAAGCAGETSPR